MNSEISFSKIIFKYGLAVFPLLLLTGPLIAELFLILAICFFCYYSIKDKNYRFFNNKYFIFFGIFYFSVFFSTIINFYNFDLAKGGLTFFRIPLFAFSIWFILEKFKFNDKKIVTFYLILFAVIIFDSLFQYYFGKNLLGHEIKYARISSFFGDELILGGFILRTLPIFLIYLVMNEMLSEKRINIYLSILISLACFVIYISGERTSFVLLFLFFFTLLFITKYLRKFIILVMIIFAAFSVILPNLINSKDIYPASRMFKKTYDQILGVGDNYVKHKKKIADKVYIFSQDHQGHYIISYNIFKDHMIFGAGVKGFRHLSANKNYILEKNQGWSTHPHNTYVEILVSNGLVGFSLLILALFFIIKEIFVCRKKIKSQNKFEKYEISKAIAISAIFINIWPLVPSGSFYNNWLSMFYFYPIGFYLYFKLRNEKKIN